jgi:hypothetical protein
VIGPHLGRGDREYNPQGFQPPVLRFEIIHFERGRRDVLLEQRSLERAARRVRVRFQHQLYVRVAIRCENSNPAEPVTQVDILAFREAQHLRIELQRLFLMFHHDAAQLDLQAHGGTSFYGNMMELGGSVCGESWWRASQKLRSVSPASTP